jgi:hypothetical protein
MIPFKADGAGSHGHPAVKEPSATNGHAKPDQAKSGQGMGSQAMGDLFSGPPGVTNAQTAPADAPKLL